ncbi:MAG: Rieske 2Fe-2S domain-containing protein [Coleofasciculus sp. S288]|nr:Rieske 2Fe-2S domain-containing protein [Coleofasciculus sp. S288]
MTNKTGRHKAMANYACVAIGINRYQFLPPLNYGQDDARELRKFLVSQANLSSSKCLLLTDTSPFVGNQSTYPSREHILRWLDAGRNTSYREGINGDSTSWRWFFFSGYGVSWNHADYLMPIDGDLNDIPGTGIGVRSLFTSLKQQGNQNLLVLLDINRSPGLQAGISVGAETVELAREMGITLVLSSQLNQFSHEAARLGNGLFTAALLEALRYYQADITLEHLEQYLQACLPELCQHHWRPTQTPLMVIPSESTRQQLILPSVKNFPINQQPVGVASAYSPGTRLDAEGGFTEDSRNGTAASVQNIPLSTAQRHPSATGIPTTVPRTTEASAQTASKTGAIVHSPKWQSKPDTAKTPWWQKLLLWGSAALILAIIVAAIALLRNRDASFTQQAIETPTATTSPPPPTATTSPTTPVATTDPVTAPSPNLKSAQPAASPQKSAESRLQANQATLAQARSLIRPNQASLFNKAIVEAREVRPGDPLYEQARQNITRWSEVILDIGEGRVEQGNVGAAIAAAQLVPKDDPSVYAKAQQMINQWKTLSTKQQENKAIIQTARQQVRPNQASSYHQAIATLRKIPAGQPGYAEAQQLITQASQTIYQLANSRASQGRLQEAIQTAALVPAGTPSHGAAQTAIAKWKQGMQQQQNQALIQAAKQQIQPSQASSYSRAIISLRKIPSDQPGHAEAQQLIAQWSKDIYLLANSRAARGNFPAAVQTAALVPADTQKVIAVNPTCTHAGCSVAWDNDQQSFVCPCHDSKFASDGKVLRGPANKPLATYEAKLEGNSVLVKAS